MKYAILLVTLFFNIKSIAQKTDVTGKIILKNFYKYDSIRINVVIKNKDYGDTLSLVFADSIMPFEFKNVPNGIYNLEVNNTPGENSFENYIITNIHVVKQKVALYPLSIYSPLGNPFYTYADPYKTKVGEKNIKEYYKSGQLYGQGKYIKDSVFLSDSSVRRNYTKIGIWKYYYKNGKLLATYNYKKHFTAFHQFYENGNIRVVGYFNNDSSDIERWKYFSKDKKLLVELEFNLPFFKKIKNKYLKNYMKRLDCFSEIPYRVIPR